jgi:hypothetical protein
MLAQVNSPPVVEAEWLEIFPNQGGMVITKTEPE